MTLRQFGKAKINDVVICNRDLSEYPWLPKSGVKGNIIFKCDDGRYKYLRILWENKGLASDWNFFYYEDATNAIAQNISSLDLVIKNAQLELEF